MRLCKWDTALSGGKVYVKCQLGHVSSVSTRLPALKRMTHVSNAWTCLVNHPESNQIHMLFSQLVNSPLLRASPNRGQLCRTCHFKWGHLHKDFRVANMHDSHISDFPYRSDPQDIYFSSEWFISSCWQREFPLWGSDFTFGKHNSFSFKFSVDQLEFLAWRCSQWMLDPRRRLDKLDIYGQNEKMLA